MTKPKRLKVVTWNTAWVPPADGGAGSAASKGARIKAILSGTKADVIVLTEGHRGLLPTKGDLVEADGDWGYEPKMAGVRKVLMWSRWPWTEVDRIGSPDLPCGRWVAATTLTPIGSVRVVGVCIPWKDALVAKSGSVVKRWEEHRRYLVAMRPLLTRQAAGLIVAGDFNQPIRSDDRRDGIRGELTAALGDLTVVTQDMINADDGKAVIDHVAVSSDLTATGQPIPIDKSDKRGSLSDHTGVAVNLGTARA